MGIDMGGRWKSYRARVRKMNAKHTDDFRRDTKRIFAVRKTYNAKEDPIYTLWIIVMSLLFIGAGILFIGFMIFFLWKVFFG